ncbi:TatD DNase [Actinomortierella ambigua]|nr:TatD DNase [Actinomortierella ambigua]
MSSTAASSSTNAHSASSNTAMRSPRFIDIGINLTDSMFRGLYHGKQAHADDLALVLARAATAGVKKMIITAGTLSEAHEALKLANLGGKYFMPLIWLQNCHGYYTTVGCHPTRCKEFDDHPEGPDAYFNGLKQVLESPESRGKVVAIGECGLDYDRLHFCPKDIQQKYFQRQFDLAETTKLPMFLHNRNTGGDFVETVAKNRHRFTEGVVHSFTGTMEEMKELVALGLYIGINGCSLKTEENLQVAAAVPVEQLMIETDAPWCDIRPTHASYQHLTRLLTPERTDMWCPPSRKKEKFADGFMVKGRNEPCTIGQVLLVLASIRGVDPNELAEQVWKNTCKVFFPGELDADATKN